MPDEVNEILQRLTRVETKLDIINSARDIGMEALQATRTLQVRVEELRDEVEQLRNKQADYQKWLIGILISSGGLFVAAVGLLLRMLGI